jgi:hypothetical protein
MGQGLLAALAAFEGRPYSGSRVILVFSDGGARLDETMQQRIGDGLARTKAALYWLYIRACRSSCGTACPTTPCCSWRSSASWANLRCCAHR